MCLVVGICYLYLLLRYIVSLYFQKGARKFINITDTDCPYLERMKYILTNLLAIIAHVFIFKILSECFFYLSEYIYDMSHRNEAIALGAFHSETFF